MGTVLYFAALALLFFVMMRFGCGSHVMGHGHHGRHGGGPREGEGTRWQPPETDVDPVCRMTVRTSTAKSAVHNGRVYYFCSAEHRDQFETAPDRYTGVKPGLEPKQMEHSHG